MTTETDRKGWDWPKDGNGVSYKDSSGYTWYRLTCKYQFGDWIEQHSNRLWAIHGQYHQGQYWVHEKLFGLILIKGV
jgi:hypothetical protein